MTEGNHFNLIWLLAEESDLRPANPAVVNHHLPSLASCKENTAYLRELRKGNKHTKKMEAANC